MPENAIQHSHIYSTYFAPRGRSRIFNLGIQLAQLYLSPSVYPMACRLMSRTARTPSHLSSLTGCWEFESLRPCHL